MTRPRLLDLFSGAGGCSVGYHRAGFDVVGIDKDPHPDYPYEFHQLDALDVLRDRDYLSTFDVVHASPPCPRYSVATHATGTRDDHPDLVGPVRELLQTWGGVICGWALGLRGIKRHRLFESNVWLMSPGCMCPAGGSVSIFGHASDLIENGVRRHVPFTEARALMGVEWMTRREDMADAIPPAYTQYLGEQLLDHVTAARA